MAFSLPDTKSIIDLVKTGMTIEAQEKIMELREAAVELKAENALLKESLAEMKRVADVKDRIEWREPFYFLRAGDKNDGPFCQLCYDKNGELIRLQICNDGSLTCLSCKNFFNDDSLKPQQAHPRTSAPYEARW